MFEDGEVAFSKVPPRRHRSSTTLSFGLGVSRLSLASNDNTDFPAAPKRGFQSQVDVRGISFRTFGIPASISGMTLVGTLSMTSLDTSSASPFSAEFLDFRSSTTPRPVLRLEKGFGGCQSKPTSSSSSSSSSSSLKRERVDGLEGRKVSCDIDGESQFPSQKLWLRSIDIFGGG